MRLAMCTMVLASRIDLRGCFVGPSAFPYRPIHDNTTTTATTQARASQLVNPYNLILGAPTVMRDKLLCSGQLPVLASHPAV